jgi:hypothetical protein
MKMIFIQILILMMNIMNIKGEKKRIGKIKIKMKIKVKE